LAFHVVAVRGKGNKIELKVCDADTLLLFFIYKILEGSDTQEIYKEAYLEAREYETW
jgi:hypothetical protein